MVTLTLGARWQAKVEEVANLKLEKQELLQELGQARLDRDAARAHAEDLERVNRLLEDRLQVLAERQGSAETATKVQESSVAGLYTQLAEKSARIAALESSVHTLQASLDVSARDLSASQTLVARLQSEISVGDSARSRLEVERDGWKAQYEKKAHDLELMTRSKEHCEKHVAILVKEKDRLMGKKPEVSPVLSQQYAHYETERPLTAPKPESFNDLEVLRLRKAVADLKAQLTAKDEETERLKKENWALVTRLRNARK